MGKENRSEIVFLLTIVALLLLAPTPSLGQALTITEGTNIAVALSPDGETLAFDLQGTLWTMSASGGKAVALTDYLGDARQPAWSPDGGRIAFQSYRDGNWHLWTIAKDGSALQQLTRGVYDDREPHWSPGGKEILFSSDRSGNYDIWKLDIASGDVSQLTDDPANDYHPSWAPNGQSISFVSERGDKAGVYTTLYPAKSGDAPTLIYSANASLASPTYSPSGRQLSVHQYDRRAGTAKLLLVELSGGAAKTLSATDEDVFPFRAAWNSESTLYYTADGLIKQIDLGTGSTVSIPFEATVNLNRPDYKRKKRDFDSTRPQPATGLVAPKVSPDGTQVALTALGNLWIVGRGGTRQLTDDAFVQAHPSWSFDGRSLVYVSDRNGTADVWKYELESGKRENLVTLAGTESYPVLSADGNTVVFYAGSPANPLSSNLLRLDLKSGATKQLMERPIPPTPISWSSPDTIVLTRLNPNSSRYREGIYEVLRISLADGSVTTDQPVPNRTLASASWAPDGSRLAFVENGKLHLASFDGDGRLSGRPGQIDAGPAATPSWAADSKTLVFASGTTIKRTDVVAGRTTEIPVQIEWRRELGEGRKVVHAGRLFNGRDLKYAHDVDIVIVDNRIESVQPHDPKLHEGTVIDASDKTVIPGLTEMHAHQSLLRGEIQGRTWLAYGVTTVREPGADAYDALERKEAWNSGQRPGPREFFSGWLIDGNRVYYSMAEGISSSEHLDLALGRAKTLNYDLIKTYVRLPDILQKKVAAAAHELGIPTSSHELFPAISYGMDAMEHAGATSRRGYSPKLSLLSRSYGDVVSLLSTTRTTFTPTLVFAGFGLTLKEQPKLMENRQFASLYGASGLQGLQMRIRMASSPSAKSYRSAQGATSLAVLRGGGRVTTGTDAPFFPFGFGLHIEINLLVQAGFTPFEALRSATLWPAEAMGIGDDLGSIEPGKLADLVILNGDPVKDIAETMSVSTTIKNGVVFTIDELLEPSK